MALPQTQIQNQTQLVKAVRDALVTDPIKNLPNLTVNNLTVNDTLRVAGKSSDGKWLRSSNGAAVWEPALGIVEAAVDKRSQLQFGVFTGGISVASPQTVNVTLPVAWPNQHNLFIGTCWPQGTWTGFQVLSPGWVNGLGAGQIEVANTSSSQNVFVQWFSIGF